MRLFVTSDRFVLRLTQGVWTDGDLVFHDFNGNPVGFDGNEVDGVHVECLVKRYKGRGLWDGEGCSSHGVAIDYSVNDHYWHPIQFVGNVRDATVSLMDLLERCDGKDKRAEKYRLLCCDCEDVVGTIGEPMLECC